MTLLIPRQSFARVTFQPFNSIKSRPISYTTRRHDLLGSDRPNGDLLGEFRRRGRLLGKEEREERRERQAARWKARDPKFERLPTKYSCKQTLSLLASTNLLEDDVRTQSDSRPIDKSRGHTRMRSAVTSNANGDLEGSNMGGVAVPRTPRTFSSASHSPYNNDEEQGSSPLLAENHLNPHNAALHASMYEDEDPDPDLLIGKVTDTETDTE